MDAREKVLLRYRIGNINQSVEVLMKTSLFSYIDNESFEEHFVSVPEQGSGKLIPEGQGKPGHVYTVKKLISSSISIDTKSFLMDLADCQGVGSTPELANTLQVCFDAGAKKILLPMSSAVDIGTVPAELFAKFQTSFYTSPEDAVF